MNYNNRDIKVAWVDLDDTLIDFHANSRRALARVYRDYSLDSLWADADSWTECYEKHNRALWALYSQGEITRPYLRMERFTRPLTEAGMPADRAERLSAELDTVYLDYLALEKELVPGAKELLHLLRSRGLTIGVLSNGFKEVQHRKINSAGLTDLIDLTVLSDDIGVNKPDVRLYRHAMECSGEPDPQAHIMIGDNPDTDIAGALAAGWSAILFDPEGKSGAACPSFASLPEIAASLCPEECLK